MLDTLSYERANNDLDSYIAIKEAELLQKASENSRALHFALYHHKNSRNQPMNFFDSYFLQDLYLNIDKMPQMVVQKSVQCGLSELFIIQSHIEAGERGLSVMYVLPKYELRNRFVNNRIYKLHKKVQEYRRMVAEASTSVHRTSLMHFGKGTLIYVGSNVEDEFIEVPVDSAYVDEKDKCNQKNLLMLPDRYSASPYKYHREIANPTVDKYGINARYRTSSQAVWTLTCDHCNHTFTPDFFTHVVREVADSVYEVIDPDFDTDLYRKDDPRTDVRLMCDKCHKDVDRLQRGRWVHAYPNKEWKGFIISKIFSKFNTLNELVVKWDDSVGNESKKQVFFNSDIGSTYSGKGNKLTEGTISECAARYTYPIKQVEGTDTVLIGVDVGSVLNYVIRRRVKDGKEVKLQLIDTGTVPGFSALAQLIRKWKPKRVVIDSMPEIHKVMELKDEFPSRVFSCRFSEGVNDLTYNKKRKEYSIDRTALLDYVLERFVTKGYIMPGNFRNICAGSYMKQLLASTRILDSDEENPEKSKFRWVHTDDDHFFLAEAYLIAAHLSLPIHDVFEFFEKEQGVQKKIDAYDKAKYIDPKNREEVAEAMRLTPEVFLHSVRQADAHRKSTQPPKVDEREIHRCITLLYDRNKYIDLKLCVNMCREHEDDVKRLLRRRGFNESAIKGQYIKE
jgi:hypothetical protein